MPRGQKYDGDRCACGSTERYLINGDCVACRRAYNFTAQRVRIRSESEIRADLARMLEEQLAAQAKLWAVDDTQTPE